MPIKAVFCIPIYSISSIPKHPLLQLARKIDWSIFEDEFSPLYSHRGKPSKRVRLMVGLSILKHMENLSDEVLIQRWVQNPYYQVFTGEVEFQWQFPCDPSDMTYFRKRIGSGGFEKILAVSIGLHQEKIREDEMCIDTTVQEKNITFPTDAKQYRKIHGHLLKIARKENIVLSRTYEKEVKKLKLHTRFANHPEEPKKSPARGEAAKDHQWPVTKGNTAQDERRAVRAICRENGLVSAHAETKAG